MLWRTQINKVLDAALSSGREAMTKGMNEGAEKVMEIVRKQEQNVLQEILGAALLKQRDGLASVEAEKFRRYCRSLPAG